MRDWNKQPAISKQQHRMSLSAINRSGIIKQWRMVFQNRAQSFSSGERYDIKKMHTRACYPTKRLEGVSKSRKTRLQPPLLPHPYLYQPSVPRRQLVYKTGNESATRPTCTRLPSPRPPLILTAAQHHVNGLWPWSREQHLLSPSPSPCPVLSPNLTCLRRRVESFPRTDKIWRDW